MAEFKHGIKNGKFMDALERLAARKSWWRDVLRDRELIIAVRKEYLNVYWQGQSIFMARFSGGEVVASTHPKYLLNPDISGQIALRGELFDMKTLEPKLLMRNYDSGVTLSKMKKAAALYSGEEKQGVHVIATSNPSVVDVEIAFNANGVADVGSIPRLDIAAFETAEEGVDLVFWEAKLFGNSEVRKAVVNQIKKYQKVISASKPQILDSYRCVAGNLVRFAEMSEGTRNVSRDIQRVADNKAKLSVSEANVGLIVYGFDAPQRDGLGKIMKDRLQTELAGLNIGKHRIRFKGKPKGLRFN
ncbi:hypothetical protein [Bradyrhizobium betae]|uniref:Uncharacterized protein n=1 Tax=Bradyrhizobium betae TaxID=244734 RepID=A0A5P6P6H5_9BRAD|nr:hypothetical protein [Bradyrhizobium betae]MCS3731375.1 hypothetical protein [Bradyrhizobium betae]QFI73967.1 hypothetical protein F8237_17065 [Bradyrhizobium betae]